MPAGGNDELRAGTLRTAAEEEKAKWKKYEWSEAEGRLEHGSHRELIRRSRNSVQKQMGARNCDDSLMLEGFLRANVMHKEVHFTDISLLGVGRQSVARR